MVRVKAPPLRHSWKTWGLDRYCGSGLESPNDFFMCVAYYADTETKIAVCGCYDIHSAMSRRFQVCCWRGSNVSHGKKKEKEIALVRWYRWQKVVCIVFLFIQVTLYRSDGISDKLKLEGDVLKVKPRNAFRRDPFNVEKFEFPLSRRDEIIRF